jgi:ADP-ribose pyrophosphatase
MIFREETLSSQQVFAGNVVDLRVDQVRIGDGSLHRRELIVHPGGVAVAALTEENELLMVRQFRYGPGEVLLELPAGKLEPGEDPFAAMQREQREETGSRSEHYESLGVVYPTPAYDSERIYLWACRVSAWCEQQLDDGELLEVERVPLFEAEQMVLDNRICDAKTQVGVLKTAALVRAGKI